MLSFQVHWQIQSDSDMAGDFLAIAGSVMILDGQREAEIVLSLIPDTVPELEELYTVQLIAVEGGATLDANPNLIRTRIRCVIMVQMKSITYIAFKEKKIKDQIDLKMIDSALIWVISKNSLNINTLYD